MRSSESMMDQFSKHFVGKKIRLSNQTLNWSSIRVESWGILFHYHAVPSHNPTQPEADEEVTSHFVFQELRVDNNVTICITASISSTANFSELNIEGFHPFHRRGCPMLSPGMDSMGTLQQCVWYVRSLIFRKLVFDVYSSCWDCEEQNRFTQDLTTYWPAKPTDKYWLQETESH